MSESLESPPRVEPAPPLPQANELTQFFWDGARRHELWIQRCDDCSHYIHTPKPMCRFCQSRRLSPSQVSGRANLYSWTVALQPFHLYFVDKIPYILATVELMEQPGLMVLSNLVGCDEEDLAAGMPLQVTYRDLTDEVTIPVFAPATGTKGGRHG